VKVNGSRPEWIARCVNTYNYHAKKLRENSAWKLQDSARTLGRSVGSICEDILLATWVKTDEDKLVKFKYIRDALVYCRERQRKLDQKEIDA
jgi:hypothetical protein